MSDDKPKPAGKKKQIQLQLPANLELNYANFALITHSRSEVVIDFAQVMPQMPRAQVKTRVVMSPLNAKLLLKALEGNLEKYEKNFSEIVIPEGRSLADELFRPFTSEDPEEEE
ncbi:MAG: DUF3467 domain-containing protein [Anaerolineales bacterium]|nr:DUF3467 domain-containing protein [Anaerolineales bacterium]